MCLLSKASKLGLQQQSLFKSCEDLGEQMMKDGKIYSDCTIKAQILGSVC